jgi:hypothetical protein
VTERERGFSAAFFSERFGPLAVGALAFLANSCWFHFVVLEHPDWGNRLLDRVIQAASVGVAFWGIAITLLIGMESKPIVQTLKKLDYFGVVVRYFFEALFATFLLLALSVLFEPLCMRVSTSTLSSVWIALGLWALLTTLRTYVVLAKILVRME